LEKVVRPGKIKILPRCVFRASNPAVVGCEVTGGIIKAGAGLLKNGKYVGEIKQLQSEGKTIDKAKIGDKIAVSITGIVIGRQADEGDDLYTDISTEDYKKLIKYEKLLSESEKSVLEEIKIMKKKENPRWGLV
jgi:translation initiation factor 5B